VSEPRPDLGKQAVQSTAWAYGSFVSGKLLVFISTIILARLLVPEEFGQVAYCLIAIQYLDILNGFGVSSAVVSRRDRIEEAANAALWIGLGTGTLLYLLSWVSAPYLADFFNEPAVTDLFRVLAIVIPISALGAVPTALIQRSMRFKAKFVPDVGRSIAKGLFSVVLAWQGFGVWSLIIGQIAGEVAATVILIALARWRPTRAFDPQVTRQMLRYGGNIIVVGVSGALITNLDYLIVGRVLGATALGYYTLAYRVPELVIRNTNYVIGKVAFPLLAQVQDQTAELKRAYGMLLRYVSLFTVPAGVGLALISPLFVHTFFTDKWESAIPVMQLIAIALGISSIGFLPGIIYKSINRPEILNRLSMVKLVATVGALLLAVRWEIEGVAAAQVALAIFFVVLDTIVVQRVLGFTIDDMLRSLMPCVVSTSVMTVGVVLLNLALDPSGLAGLILVVAIAVLIFALTLAVVSRETVTKARKVVRSAFARAT
jgi:O-antigen/teichoic acid export membrane protein